MIREERGMLFFEKIKVDKFLFDAIIRVEVKHAI